MTTKNPLLDDLADLMTGAMGAAKVAGEEVRTATQARFKSVIADMDLVSREEVEALRAIALQALAQVEVLEKRIDALEKDNN